MDCEHLVEELTPEFRKATCTTRSFSVRERVGAEKPCQQSCSVLIGVSHIQNQLLIGLTH